jgi:hypothetical protein
VEMAEPQFLKTPIFLNHSLRVERINKTQTQNAVRMIVKKKCKSKKANLLIAPSLCDASLQIEKDPYNFDSLREILIFHARQLCD